MQLKEYSKHIFIGLLLLVLYMSWKIIKPYGIAILSAFILSYLFYPLFAWFKKKIKNNTVSALIVILIIVLIALVPLALLLNSLIRELNVTTVSFAYQASDYDFLDSFCIEEDSKTCRLYNHIKVFFPEFNIKGFITETSKGLKASAMNWLRIITNGVLQFFITLYIVFFLLIDGDKLVTKIKKTLLLKKLHEKKIISTLEETTHAVVFGNIITALIQGLVAAVGYYIIGGLNNVVLLGLATAFFALIPFLGSAIIWFPACIYLLLLGFVDSSGSMILRSFLLLAYGTLIISTIDNILKPKIIGSRANIHPVIVLLGVLGGLKFLNVPGIIIGPVVLAVFIKLIEIFDIERKKL